MYDSERLEQAFDVFLQYGFRKTSMDDLARGMGVSRQALYKQFKNKQEIFEAACMQMVTSSEEEAIETLKDLRKPAKERILTAIDCMFGCHVDDVRNSPHGKELVAIAEEGKIGEERYQEVVGIFTEIFEEQSIAGANGSAPDTAAAIILAAKGTFHVAENHSDFLTKLNQILNAILPD